MHAYKSEVVIFSASHQHPNDRRGRVKSLGVTIDSHLRFDCHASDVECACNHHTRALRHVRSLLSDEVAQTVACSIVASRLDYCNALLYGAPTATINKLQRAQNNLARVVCQRGGRTSAAPLPQSYTGCRCDDFGAVIPERHAAHGVTSETALIQPLRRYSSFHAFDLTLLDAM